MFEAGRRCWATPSVLLAMPWGTPSMCPQHNWTKVVPLKKMTHKEVIEFITKHIIHRFSIPQTLTLDLGTSFVSKEVHNFFELYKIKLLNSSPYYTQANGQAKSSDKTLIKFIKKKIEDNPRRWHDVLSIALWEHRISRDGATNVTPFELVYGQKAVLPIEVNLDAYRFAKQNNLFAVMYHDLMMDNVNEVADKKITSSQGDGERQGSGCQSYN